MELLAISSDSMLEVLISSIYNQLGFIDTPFCQESVDFCSRRLSGRVDEYPPELVSAIEPVYDYYPDYFAISGFIVYLRAGTKIKVGNETIRYPKLIARLEL